MSDLVNQLSSLLKEKTMTLATAESCTGGLLSATMTHTSGASEVFERGFITYSNQSKMDSLEVPEIILTTHGAVSAETAEAMAKGAIKNSLAGIAISITGVAGPDGGTKRKPVGLVYFGYALKGGAAGSFEHNFKGTREQVRTAAAIAAIKHLITILEDVK